MLFLGDQVYADETTDAMREFISARRDIEEPPWTELKDYQEYAHLYSLAWTDDTNRWLLSTLPTAMIFDDHDIRDDWNTSQAWRDEMEATSWWHGRIVAGLASYWVYQHLGNLSPAGAPRGRDLAAGCVEHEGDDELDLTEVLDAFADRVDQEPQTYRWSYAREFGDQARLVVVDSRAARVLDPDERALLDPDELAWLDEHMRGDVDHLLIGTSLPFMLARGLHHLEAAGEAMAAGAWGRRGAERGGVGPPARRPRALGGLPGQLPPGGGHGDRGRGRAQRGRAPVSVTFLSGDVHHSYVSEARLSRRTARRSPAAAEPADPGGVLADPQPAVAQHALRDRGAQLRRGGTARAAGVAVDQGADEPDHVEVRRGAVVRQQPGVPGAGAAVAADVVGQRQGGRRRPRCASADEGRRLRPSGDERLRARSVGVSGAPVSTRPWAQVHASEHGR